MMFNYGGELFENTDSAFYGVFNGICAIRGDNKFVKRHCVVVVTPTIDHIKCGDRKMLQSAAGFSEGKVKGHAAARAQAMEVL